jgi:hypothetical protein
MDVDQLKRHAPPLARLRDKAGLALANGNEHVSVVVPGGWPPSGERYLFGRRGPRGVVTGVVRRGDGKPACVCTFDAREVYRAAEAALAAEDKRRGR